jgi:hypothetical protein
MRAGVLSRSVCLDRWTHLCPSLIPDKVPRCRKTYDTCIW